jgi:hypothetical protein
MMKTLDSWEEQVPERLIQPEIPPVCQTLRHLWIWHEDLIKNFLPEEHQEI